MCGSVVPFEPMRRRATSEVEPPFCTAPVYTFCLIIFQLQKTIRSLPDYRWLIRLFSVGLIVGAATNKVKAIWKGFLWFDKSFLIPESYPVVAQPLELTKYICLKII